VNRDTRSRAWRELKPFVGPALIVVVYAVMRVVESAVADGHGMLTPSGSMDGTRAVLGIATLAMRIFILVVVLFATVYRLVIRMLRAWTTRRPHPNSPVDPTP
jgi:hypothetical protein